MWVYLLEKDSDRNEQEEIVKTKQVLGLIQG